MMRRSSAAATLTRIEPRQPSRQCEATLDLHTTPRCGSGTVLDGYSSQHQMRFT